MSDTSTAPRSQDPVRQAILLSVWLLLAVWAASLSTYAIGVVALRREAQKHQDAESVATAQHVTRTVESLVNDLTAFARDGEWSEATATDSEQPLTLGLCGRDPTGAVVGADACLHDHIEGTSPHHGKVVLRLHAPSEDETRLLSGRRAVVGVDESGVMLVSIPVMDHPDTMTAVMQASIRASALLGPRQGWWVGLADGQGRILAQSGPPLPDQLELGSRRESVAGVGVIAKTVKPVKWPSGVKGPSWRVIVAGRARDLYGSVALLGIMGACMTAGASGTVVMLVIAFARRQKSLLEEIEERATSLQSTTESLQQENAARERAESHAADLVATWQRTFESMSDGIWVLDLEGRITLSNGVWENSVGLSPDETVGRHCFEVLHGAEARPPGCRFQQALDARESEEFEFEDTARSRWWHVTVNPVTDQSGEVTAIVHVMRDITEATITACQLRQANIQLEAALNDIEAAHDHVIRQERLRALGQMASGIAHDFNNALSPILGYTELLLSRPENLNDPDKVKRYVERMRTAADDASHIVQRMREFYREREPSESREPVDVNVLVEDTLGLTQPRWREQAAARGVRIAVNTELNATQPVSGNPPELREALTNLVLNAIDAMPEGGDLIFRTRDEEDSVVIEVEDTGVGMPEDVRQRCLEPFFSTKGEHGTGMGLAEVHGIIRRHDGVLNVDSEVGRGTKFIIGFPRLEEEGLQQESEVEEQITLPPLRILLVDDDERVRKVVGDSLRADGHEVILAEGGQQGLDLAGQETFDVVITDRAMPGVNGDQVALGVKEHAPDTPVIMLTGFADMMKTENEHPPGVDLILAKPASPADLRAALAQVIEGTVSAQE